jgi:hypothetical protein
MKRKIKRRNKIKFSAVFREHKGLTDYFPGFSIKLMKLDHQGRSLHLYSKGKI